MFSTKDLVFKEQPAKKLADQYVGSYFIEEVVSQTMVQSGRCAEDVLQYRSG